MAIKTKAKTKAKAKTASGFRLPTSGILEIERGGRPSRFSPPARPEAGSPKPEAKTRPTTPKTATIDDYLAALSVEKRAALEALRKIIRAAAPKAEECISYQLPAFRQDGMLVGFGATANHCAFYLMSASTVQAHEAELVHYDTSKGTIRFHADTPLPVALVRKLVKARLAENVRRRFETRRD